MAISAGSPVTYFRLYLKWNDLATKAFSESDLLIDPNAGGSSTFAADLVQFLTDLDTLSNAKFVTITLQTITEVHYSGQKASAANNSQNTVDVQMLLKLVTPNPLVTGRFINEPFVIPAPNEGSGSSFVTQGPTTKGVFQAGTVPNRVVSFLTTYLAYKYPGDDVIRNGPWTFDSAHSKELSVSGTIDPKD